MKIYWCTTRHFEGDLCATTQIAILERLHSLGHDLTVLGPDFPSYTHTWEHIQLNQSSMKGRRAWSLGRSMRAYLKKMNLEESVLLIDWALVKPLSSLAEQNGAQWLCIDRSPPADANIFAKIQCRVWKKAWTLAAASMEKNRGCIGGTVVSNVHQKLISSQFSIRDEKLCILHAGVDTQLFQRTNRESLGLPIKMVYHGKMDKNRGILKLLLLVDALENSGIQAELNLIGSGDLAAHLTRLAHSKSNLNFYGSVQHSEIPGKLRDFEIGLLPMPNLPVWAISSPLKRSEYISTGLLVLGINHTGHLLPSTSDDHEWYRLFDQQSFVDDSIEQIQRWIGEDNFSELSRNARQYAESELSWEITTQSFVELIENLER